MTRGSCGWTVYGGLALVMALLGLACNKSEPPAAGAEQGPAAPSEASSSGSASSGSTAGAAVPAEAEAPVCPAELAAFLAKSPTYLHLSDIHLDLQDGGSDTGPHLWWLAQTKLAQVLACPNPPSFVLYTGDLPGHFACTPYGCDVPATAKQQHTDNIRVVLADLAELVAKGGAPLLYLPGNNDSLAGDYFSFSDASGATPLSTVKPLGYPSVNVSASCDAHPAPCVVDPGDPKQGYFSVRPVEGLRVLALNSVVFGPTYEAVDGVDQATVAADQLAWLEAQLDALADTERALIAMHIPPGIDSYGTCCKSGDACTKDAVPRQMWAKPAWQDRLLAAVEAHEAQVVGLAYGHTHYDELRRIHAGKNDEAPVVELGVGGPGITFNHGNNPAFKLVAYDAQTKELTDFLTLHTTKDASEWGEGSMRMREVFGCEVGAVTMLDCVRDRDTAAVAADIAKIYMAGASETGCASAAQTIAVGVPVVVDG